ncbi:MAG: SAM-dependent methyltransferase [Alphaproteobacteria bacterium]
MTDEALKRWNERFAAPGYLFGTAPNRFLESQRALLKPGGRALAVADGEGRNGVWLARQDLAVTAVDFSPVALAKARALAKRSGVALETIEADLAGWQWPPAAYDVVAAIFIQFAPPPLRAKLFAAMQAALEPGGLLLLEGYRPEQIAYGTGGPPNAENMYTRGMLEAEFATMEILHLAEYDAAIEEGAGHKGMSALIDLVARKRA